jgi:23S rRNA pseudouridine1911/1915/1917 synthase
VSAHDYELREHAVRGRETGERLDKLLADTGLVPSRSAGQRLIEGGLVRVNGEMIAKNHRVQAGEWIEVSLPPEDATIEPEDVQLDVRYEDENLIVLSKPAGMVVHPTDQHLSGTLVNALLAHTERLGGLGSSDRPGIVHRLDKDTSGLMLVAKDDETQRLLQEAIRIRAVDRRYVTLVHGAIAPDTGLVDAPIGRHPRRRMRMTVSHEEGSRQAVTNFTVLERFGAGYYDDGYTLLECKLHTGRTHQIRVHMAYIKHHVVGDPFYGRRSKDDDMGLCRQFLHSYRLGLDHPRTGRRLDFEDRLPDDLAEVLEAIGERSDGRTQAGEQVGHILTRRAR